MSMAVIVAVGVNTDGLRGVKRVISDNHEGIKAAASEVFRPPGSVAACTSCATRWRTRARRSGAWCRPPSARCSFRTPPTLHARSGAQCADQLQGKFPKHGALMDEAEHGVLAFMSFPRAHWAQIYSTNPLERLHAEIKRRANVVGIFPNNASIVRLVGAMVMEQNDEWSLNRRYMQLEGLQTVSDTAPTRLPAVAR